MRYSRTRLMLKYANRCPCFGAAALLLFAGLVLTPWFVPVLVRDLRLARFGKTTRAVITGKVAAARGRPRMAAAHLFAHGGGRPRRPVRYEFTVGGRVCASTERVHESEWQALRVGQPVEVVYLPADPNVCRLTPPLWQTSAVVPLGIGLAACVGAVVCTAAAVRDVRRRVRLICEGLPVPGLIDAVEVGTSRKGRRYVRRVAYRYLVERDGRLEVRPVELAAPVPCFAGELTAGDVVVVACDPDDPNRHELDWFRAREADRELLLAGRALA